MPLPKIRINGAEKKIDGSEESQVLKLRKGFELNETTRSAGAEPQELDLRKDDILQFEFEDGTVWVSTPDRMDEIFPGGLPKRGDGSNVIDIPDGIFAAEQERGIVKTILLKALKVFTKKEVLAPAIGTLATKVEDTQLGKTRGLLRLDKDFNLLQEKITDDGTYLLFIHGTGSSTDGSFGELKKKGDTKLWDYIHQKYEGKVLAFQHETLTLSPFENVLKLVQQLPQKATLHLISHSRGGLVGDILNRYCNSGSGQKGFSADERNYLNKNGRAADLLIIEKIDKAILAKNIVVEKFIRVACPASGTTLASKRLDYLFNIILSLVASAVGTAAPAVLALKELIAGILETKDDTTTLPGIEAMNPSSPLLQMLNNPEPAGNINSPLYIIAGNAKVSLQWKALVVIASKLFYLDKNDFVVDTRSMYNGARRADGIVQYFLDEGGEVSHFNYFLNLKTKNAILLALQSTAGKLVPGFTLLPKR